MKNILVTGAAGFIGSQLTENLIDNGFNVRAFDRYNPYGSFGWLDSSDKKNHCELILGDVRDYDSINRAIKGCDTVFHLAALIGIPYSYISPSAYLKTNIEGTLNVLQSGLNNNVDLILNTSTSETYGTAQYTPIDENHPKVGQSPYSATKIASDALCESFARSFDLRVFNIRPFNTYGPRQSQRAVIPQIIQQVLLRDSYIALGDISTIRDLVYVEDTIAGFLKIAKSIDKIKYTDCNICTSNAYTIEEIAKKIMKICGKELEIKLEKERIRPNKSEVFNLIGDNTRLKEITNWTPQTNIDIGLKKTIEWFKKQSLSYSGYQV